MPIGAIGSTPFQPADASGKPNDAKEVTTVTTKCEKDHQHNQSCPHTVSTKPAPKAGEDGYFLDQKA